MAGRRGFRPPGTADPAPGRLWSLLYGVYPGFPHRIGHPADRQAKAGQENVQGFPAQASVDAQHAAGGPRMPRPHRRPDRHAWHRPFRLPDAGPRGVLLQDAVAAAVRPAASMLEIKPGSGFFSVFSGFRVRLSRTFPQRSPQGVPSGHAGNARRGGPGRPEGDSLRVPDGRGPSVRQAAGTAVRSSHIRRSRRRALAVTTSPRMTATRATLWGFPLSRSRWYRCHETSRRLPSRVIRCKGMTMDQHVVAGSRQTAIPAL